MSMLTKLWPGHGERAWRRDALSIGLIIGSAILNAATWVMATRLAAPHQSVTPLHYTIYFGVDLTSNWPSVFLLPGVSLVILVANCILTTVRPELVWRRMWLSLALLANILLFLTTALLVYTQTLS